MLPRAVLCHYARDPARRPHCALTAEITLGRVALCGSCAAARSTLGKGIAAVPLPAGPPWMSWTGSQTRPWPPDRPAATWPPPSPGPDPRAAPGPGSPAGSASPARPRRNATGISHHSETRVDTMTTTTIETGALDKALRTLKLSGMLDTIEARLGQARAGELGHIEFLQVLCEDEISRRQATSICRRLRKARFEEQATLEGFDFAASPKLPAAQIRDLAALRWLQAGESVILYGPVGVGKSHVAQALGHLAIRHGADARFLKTSRALAHLAGGHADNTWHKRLGEPARPAVLILDDFAMRELTATQADDLYELITERAGASLILTSNRAPQDWYPLFPNPVVAESLLDRVINNSHQVYMNGPSYRPRKRPGQRVTATGKEPAQ